MRTPTTNPDPIIPVAKLLQTSWLKLVAVAAIEQGMSANTSNAEKTKRGPKRSRIMPTTIRAGMVKARLQIAKTFSCSVVNFKSC